MKKLMSVFIVVLMSLLVLPIRANSDNLKSLFSDDLIDYVNYSASHEPNVELKTDDDFLEYVKTIEEVGFIQEKDGNLNSVMPSDFRGIEQFSNLKKLDIYVIVGEDTTNSNNENIPRLIQNFTKLPDKFVENGGKLNIVPSIHLVETNRAYSVEELFASAGNYKKVQSEDNMKVYRENFGAIMESLIQHYDGESIQANIPPSDFYVDNFDWIPNKNNKLQVEIDLENSNRYFRLPLHEHKVNGKDYWEIEITEKDIPNVVIPESEKDGTEQLDRKVTGIDFKWIKKYVQDNLSPTGGIAEFEILVDLSDGNSLTVNQDYVPTGTTSDRDKFFSLSNSVDGYRGEIKKVTLRFPVTADITDKFEKLSDEYRDYIDVSQSDMNSNKVVNHDFFEKNLDSDGNSFEGLKIESYYVNSDNTLRKGPNFVTAHFLPYFTKQYNVDFVSDGGYISQIKLWENAYIETPDDPILKGHIFKGWSSAKNSEEKWEFETDHVKNNMTLYAIWKKAILVTFDTDNGKEPFESYAEKGALLTEPDVPSCTISYCKNKKFGGWVLDRHDYSTKWNFEEDKVIEAMTLFAAWVDEFDVTFETDGGSSVPSQKVIENEFATRPNPDPTKDGYTFKGWYQDSGFTLTWDFATQAITENTSIYAKWEKNPVFYDVTFETDGGSSVAAQSVKENEFAARPNPDPTKDGYTFKGWYQDSGFTLAWDFATQAITENTSIYAKWEKNPVFYDVTFETDGGSSVATQSVKENEFAARPNPDPTKDGYTFKGWYQDNGFTLAWDFATQAITENTSIYAKWEKNPVFYDVTFETDGGSSVAAQSVKENEFATRPNPDPTKDGYTFKGWYQDSGFTLAWDFATQAITENTSIYAKWEKNSTPVVKYTVNFEPNGGTAVDTITVEEGSLILKPVSFREGYDFQAWYQDKELTDPWIFESDRVTKDTTLYAKWEKRMIPEKKHTVSFVTYGGTPVNPIIVTDGSKIDHVITTLEGYIFAGWYKESFYNTAWNFGADIVTEDTVLHAKWEREPVTLFTVDFDSHGGSEVASQTVAFGAFVDKPENPQRDGYIFKGWYIDNAMSTAWNFEETAVVSNLTLHAKWEEESEKETLPNTGLSSVSGLGLGMLALGSVLLRKKKEEN